LSKRRSIEINSPGGYGYYNTAIQNKYVVTNTLNMRSFGRHNLSGVVGSTYEQNDIISQQLKLGFASDLQLNVISGY
jgi:hypothetical protein